MSCLGNFHQPRSKCGKKRALENKEALPFNNKRCLNMAAGDGYNVNHVLANVLISRDNIKMQSLAGSQLEVSLKLSACVVH